MLTDIRHQIDHWRDRERYRRLRTSPGEYSLQGCDKLRCVFVHVPKSGGLSVNQALFGNKGGGHRTVETYKKALGPLTYYRYFSFTFVRNPFSRLVSAYTFLKGGGLNGGDEAWARANLGGCDTFDDFVRGVLNENIVWSYYHFKPQYHFVCEANGQIGVDFVGRYERMGSDFRRVCRRLGIDTTLQHHNATGRSRPWETYYRPETAARVSEVYQRDFEIFGYSPSLPNRTPTDGPV